MGWKRFAGGSLLLAIAACSDATTPLPSGTAGTPTAGGTPATDGAAGVLASSGAAGAGQPATAGVAGAVSAGGAIAGGSSGGSSAGGAGGSAGGGDAGASAAGGTTADGWVNLFNGKDLSGWVRLIHKWQFNEDPYETFRADAVNQVIRVTYEDYPEQNFDDHCGLLYYDKPLKDYRVRLTYRFREPQAKNPVSWGKNNTGLMIFGIDPRTVVSDPEFPPLIEIQLIGTPSSGGTKNANLCQPGIMRVSTLFGEPLSDNSCHDSKSGTAPAAGEWVTIEAEVHVSGDTKVFQHPDMTNPVLTISGPTYMGQPVTEGYLALQSESQPVEYKDIQLKELP